MFKHLTRMMSGGFLALALVAAAGVAHAYTYKIVHIFTGKDGDGTYPRGTPIMGRDGIIYGTTEFGGSYSCGALYKFGPDGTYSIVHEFGGWENGDGCLVKPGVTQDRAGNLYGATTAEGAFGATGSGIVYKIAPNGTETVLHSFNKYDPHDGIGPFSPPMLGADGNLYGTTVNGGKYICELANYHCGTIYRIKPDGSFKLLYAFKGGRESAFPTGTLIPDDDGNLYGTAPYTSGYSYGTVFKITLHGELTNVYAFRDKTTGGNPQAGLIKDRAGNFYGTTNTGGAYNLGAIFKVTADGSETVLHSFTGADGAHPQNGKLARDKDGNLYGTGYDLGPEKGGVVYQLTPDGTLNVLHAFNCDTGECSPVAGVVLDRAGNIFGTTYWGAPGLGTGAIFELVK